MTKTKWLHYILLSCSLFVHRAALAQEVDAETFFAEGLIAYRGAQYSVAETKFVQAAGFVNQVLLPDFIYYFLGLTQLQLGKDQDAIASFRSVSDFKSNFKIKTDAQLRMVRLFLKSKDFVNASGLLRSLERRLRGEELYPEVLYLLTEAEMGRNKKDQACKWAKKLYAKYPGHNLTSTWTLDLNEVEISKRKLGCAVSDEDFSGRVRYLQLSGKNDQAQSEIEILQKRSGQKNSLAIDKIWAQFLIQESEPYEALQLLLKYYSDERGKFDYLMDLAVAASRSGEAALATGLYYSAYELQPKSRDGLKALYYAAFLSYQFQDYDGATRKFSELIERSPRSSQAMESLWHLAWLRYLKRDYVGAEFAFKDLAHKRSQFPRRYSFPLDRSKYWLAMSIYRQGRTEEARVIFEELVKHGQLGYYSIAAFHRLEGIGAARSVELTQIHSSAEVAEDEEERAEEQVEETAGTEEENTEGPEESTSAKESKRAVTERLLRVDKLDSLGLTEWAKWELYEVEKRTSDPTFLRQLITEYIKTSAYNRASYIGQVYFALERARLGFKNARSLWEATYPRAYEKNVLSAASEFSVEEEFIWSIMRAESMYKREVVSPVGAIGLMQVMPFTGERISKSVGIERFSAELLFDPEVIIRVGAKYLQHLSKKFDRSIPLAAAAYNAGPHRVSQWLYAFGYLDMDEFIEHVPFLETRNYMKKVMSNYVIYKRLYANSREEPQLLASVVPVYLSSPPPLKETWEGL